MFNLIKMDLYRMFHSVSTWVILLLTVGVAVFCIAATNIDIELMAEDPQYAEKMLDETEEEEAAASQELQLGISAESDPHWIYGDIDAGDLLSIEIKSGIVTLLVVIFAAIFAGTAVRATGTFAPAFFSHSHSGNDRRSRADGYNARNNNCRDHAQSSRPRRGAYFQSYDQPADLINDQRDDPCHRQLKKCGKARPFPAFRFFSDGRQSCRARNIQETKHHEADRIERTEPDSGESAHKLR